MKTYYKIPTLTVGLNDNANSLQYEVRIVLQYLR